MRINRYIALASGLSRRKADSLIASGRITINGRTAAAGDMVTDNDTVMLDDRRLQVPAQTITIMLHKPAGYVSSRNGQGSKTVYDLLPPELRGLKPIGRLDKDSSGLLLMTNNGQLAHELMHPSFQKNKIYQVTLDTSLEKHHKQQTEQGVVLTDGTSRFKLNGSGRNWAVTIQEGRNRQIRRTFEALGYKVTKLHRTHVANYRLKTLKSGHYTII